MELGRSANYINSIENGKYFPSPETIEQIAAVLGIEPIRLFDGGAQGKNERCIQQDDLRQIEQKLHATISADITKIFAEVTG